MGKSDEPPTPPVDSFKNPGYLKVPNPLPMLTVVNLVHNAKQKGEDIDIPVLCATVRQRVCDMLITNTLKAAEITGYKKIAVAGGVSANSELRKRLTEECEKKGLELYYPPLKYCGDNAAMVGAQALYEYQSGNISGAELNATATLPIDYRN